MKINDVSKKAQVFIVGEIPCCVCGGMMSQKDVNEGTAILLTSKRQFPFIGIIAHVNHFYVLEDKQVQGQTPDYDLNLKKFVLAVARDHGDLQPHQERSMVRAIEQAEKDYKKTIKR